MAWDWLKAALAKVGSLLIRPKGQPALKDQSFRQTNILSKTENTFIVMNPRTSEMLVGNYGNMPKEVLEAIRARLEYKTAQVEERPEIRLIRDDFYDETINFQAHVEAEDELLKTISRYINPEYASIFWLGSYARYHYDRNERREAEEIKSQVGEQYGRDGRKLCNLYVKGYISEMMEHYLGPITESARDKGEIGVHLNTLIRKMIQFSGYIFFIHRGSDVAAVAAKVKDGVLKGARYIALHSAGIQNIKRTLKIIDEIGPDFLDKHGYGLSQVRPPSTASIPFFDVFITPKGAARGADEADESTEPKS